MSIKFVIRNLRATLVYVMLAAVVFTLLVVYYQRLLQLRVGCELRFPWRLGQPCQAKPHACMVCARWIMMRDDLVL